MAIKISGNTIIDDSRVVTNAERVGIGITPRYDLEVLSDTLPTGIAASVTNAQSDDVNKGLLVFNKNVAAPTFTVSYRGRVDALEYHGVFKGSIDPGVAIDKADKINIQTNSSNVSQYLTFVDSTSGYEDVKVHTGIRYNPNFYGNGGSSRLSIDGDVGIAGTLTYEDVTNVDSIGLVTARTGVRITTGGLIVNAGISSFGAHIYPSANETHNIGESDSNRFNAVYAKEFRGGTFYGTIDGGVSLVADTVKTVKRSTNASHYLTFVDSNNDAATAESMYTDGDITYNPNTNELVVPKIKPAGIINASGGSGTANYVIQADGSGGWDWGLVEPGNIGTLNFTDLDDTPGNYTNAGGKLVRVNSGANGLEFITASDAGKTYTLDAVDSGDNAILRLSDGSNNDDVLITAGSNITINPVAAGGFTIAAEDGAGLGVAASADDILSVTNGQIAGDSAGADKIVFWDNSGTKLTYLTVGNGLNITGTEITATSDAGKTYTLEGVDSGDNAILRLSDGSTNDDVLITAGTGITLDPVAAGGFTINATGGGSLSNLDVKQFSNHTTTPKTERTCPNPIEVNVSGIGATIGIGSTSNAYGRRYIQDTAPSTGVCEGDIWFDTSTPSSGSSRVAILRDEKDAGAYGGKPGAGEYAGYRGAYVPGPTGGGGTFDPDTWFPRNINTKYDPNSFVSVGIGSTSTFGLEAGSYKINWRVPAFHVDRFQSRLAYNTNSDFSGTTSYYYGTSQYSGGDPNYPSGGNFANSSDESEGEFVTTISATTYFKIEQWIYTEIYTPSGQTDFSDSALGVAINRDSQTNAKLNPLAPGHEVYTQVKIEDLSTAVKDGAFGDKIQEGNTKAEVVDTGSNGHFLVETENTERLRITSAGQLNLAGNMQFTAANPELEFNNGGPRFRVPSSNTLSVHTGGGLGATSNERLRITQGGDVGIGTTNPDAVVTSSTTAKLAVGIVTAFKYYGDGSNLTGISGGGSSDPVGTIVAWSGSVASIPSEYQLCDGSAASTSALQAITGANVPDLRSRFIVGAHNVSGTGSWPNVGVGSTGGAATHTLTTNEIPSHTHTQTEYSLISTGGGGSGTRRGSAQTVNTGATGGGQAHNNLPPYYALCYIIKHTATSGSGGGAGSAIILLAEKTATGASVEFTGIPSDAMEITVMLKGVSANGGNDFVVQLGTSSGYITSGYVSNSENTMGTSNVASNTTNNAGFVIFADTASSELHGSMIINKASSTSYTEIGEFRRSNAGGSHARGSLSSVSGTVDRLKILLNGTNTFDGGILSVSYKTSGGGSTSGHTKVAVVKDQKNYNVDGGTFVQGGWRDRDLTVKDDPFGFVTLYPTSNGETTPSPGNDPGYFSLPAGKYKIKFRAPAFKVDSHMAAMLWSSTESNISKTYATTDARDGESYGSSEISQDDNGRVSNHSVGVFVVEITQTSYFKVIHYGKDTQSDNGFGESANIGNPDPETYTIVEIEDLATATKSGVTIGDKIEEGDTSAEVIDTGSDGHFIVKAEGKEKFRVNGSTNNIFIGGHTSDNPFTYLRFAASQYGAADIRPMDELNHKIGLSFYTDNTQDSTINPAERMHLTHNGILNIGRAVGGSSADPVNATGNVTAGVKLLGATSSATPGDGFAMVANALTTVGIFNRTNSTGAIIEVKNNGNTVGSIYTPNGTGTTYGSNSDYRLKENVVNLTDGITRLKTLKPYRFNFKTDTSTTVDGFLAHEVTAVPEAIIGTKDQVDSDNNPVYQQIDQSKLVPLLVAALQEAVAKIEILETEVAALKG